MSLPCSIRDLIPQKGKMSFDQTLLKTETDDGQSTAVINKDNIFLDDNNRLSNIVLIEYVNQLVAAVQGYDVKYNNETAKKGLFVGLQDAEFFQTVSLGDLLTIKRFLVEEIAPVNFVQGIIYREQEKIAEFVTKIYEIKDTTEFSSLTNHGQILQRKNVIVNNQTPPSYLSSNMQRRLYSFMDEIKIGDDFVSFNIACPEDFEVFDGHFPKNPILPGVILLEISRLALQLFMKKPLVLTHLKKMKINGVVLPNQVITCNITINNNNGSGCSFSALFKEGEEREISRFTGTCSEGRK